MSTTERDEMIDILDKVFEELREKSTYLNTILFTNVDDMNTEYGLGINHANEYDFKSKLNNVVHYHNDKESYEDSLKQLSDDKLSVFYEEVKAFVTAFSTRIPMNAKKLMGETSTLNFGRSIDEWPDVLSVSSKEYADFTKNITLRTKPKEAKELAEGFWEPGFHYMFRDNRHLSSVKEGEGAWPADETFKKITDALPQLILGEFAKKVAKPNIGDLETMIKDIGSVNLTEIVWHDRNKNS